MSLEEFNRIKKQFEEIMDEAQKVYEENKDNKDFDEEITLKEFLIRYKELENYLLSHNLSDIPFESWKGVQFIYEEDKIFDFSKTQANLDFNIASLGIDKGNYTGCNLRNIERLGSRIGGSIFDENTQKKYPNIFLSNTFEEEFKKKFYSRQVTLEDYKKLSNTQKEELRQKNKFIEHFDWHIVIISKDIGFDKLYKLYEYSEEDYTYITELLSVPGFYFSEKLSKEIKEMDVSKIKSACIDFVRNNYLVDKKIKIKDIPEFFIKENDDIFLTNVDMPNDLRERYYNRNLTEEDIINNLELFKNIPIEKFIEYGYVREFAIRLGPGNFQKLLTNYLDIYMNLKKESQLGIFVDYNPRHDLDTNIYNILKKYILEKYNSQLYNTDFVLPDWLSTMNFKIVREYNNIERIKSYDKSTIVLDKRQNMVLASCDLEQILKIQEELNLFSNISVFNQFGTYLINNYPYNTKVSENLTDIIATFLSKNKTQINYDNIKGDFREKYKSIFIKENAPQKLKILFYNRQISIKTILNNPEYIDYIKDTDIELLFQEINIKVGNTKLITYLNKKYNHKHVLSTILKYGKYIDIINSQNRYYRIDIDKLTDQETLIEDLIYMNIVDNGISYDENMPKEFKDKYPYLFLPENTPKEIKEKFYNKQFKPQDFLEHPDLLKYFINTDIACGLSSEHSWAIGLLNEPKELNKKIKILEAFSKIDNIRLKETFKQYILKNADNIHIDKIDIISELLFRLSVSNSSELSCFGGELANQLMILDNPIESLNKIEDVFLRNNLPTVGKIYSVFQILHPDCKGFNFNIDSRVSPILKNNNTNNRNIIIFSDLLKSSFGSNNRSIKKYLDNIEKGNLLFNRLSANEINIEQLSEEDSLILSIFVSHLNTLYNNSRSGLEKSRKLSGNIEIDLRELIPLFKTTNKYDLPDRIIRMFGFYAGFKSFEQAKKYFEETIKYTEEQNRINSQNEFTLEEGDFVKGIGDITYLSNILQNGSVAKEFLGSSASSDATPLDTDLSMILNQGNNINETLNNTAASNYGPIWIVLKKNDSKFVTTRSHTDYKEKNISRENLSKLEVFCTGFLGNNHYGVRTGFPSSNIDYFLTRGYDPRVGLEIAMNGFYIPVVDKNTGKIVFTPKDYDDLRSKMSGLSYYDCEEYVFAEELTSPEIEELASQIELNQQEVSKKSRAINEVINKVIKKFGLTLKNNIDGDLTPGSIELIDTGSTGRGTNMIGDGDFDFMMRLDRGIITNPQKITEIKSHLLSELVLHNGAPLTTDGDFRLKNVSIDGLDTPVDIDITFVQKNDTTSYSTDSSVKERLQNIKKQNPEKYNLVIANIIMAKKILKKYGAYKPHRSDATQGGMGGVGIENWILQNGGSFKKAASEFLTMAKGRTFEEFKQIYYVWDFGENHLASKKNTYPHDNFIENNMNEEGYYKMQEALKEYLQSLEHQEQKNTHR